MKIKEADKMRDHVVRTRLQPARALRSPNRVPVPVRSVDIARELNLE
jgi:hypothetical protein